MKNPLNKRLPRELKSEFGKHLVLFIFLGRDDRVGVWISGGRWKYA